MATKNIDSSIVAGNIGIDKIILYYLNDNNYEELRYMTDNYGAYDITKMKSLGMIPLRTLWIVTT